MPRGIALALSLNRDATGFMIDIDHVASLNKINGTPFETIYQQKIGECHTLGDDRIRPVKRPGRQCHGTFLNNVQHPDFAADAGISHHGIERLKGFHVAVIKIDEFRVPLDPFADIKIAAARVCGGCVAVPPHLFGIAKKFPLMLDTRLAQSL